jgi:hypothetical protein
MTLTIEVQPYLEDKIRYLLSKQKNSDFLINDYISHKILETEKAIFNIEKDLRKFEKKYNLSTSEFYKQYETGFYGDEDDFMFWAGLHELHQKNINEL